MHARSDTPYIQTHDCRSIVLDLVILAGRIQASMELVERAIYDESPLGNLEVHDHVVVLDDVTPYYAKASAALHACHAALGQALHSMQGTLASDSGSDRRTQSRGGTAG